MSKEEKRAEMLSMIADWQQSDMLYDILEQFSWMQKQRKFYLRLIGVRMGG